MFFTISVSNSLANPTEYPTDLEQTFKKVFELELYLLQNPGKTLTSITTSRPDLTAGIDGNANYAFLAISESENTLGISAFLWGFCLGIIGNLFSDNDKALTKKALTGCIVAYGYISLIYVLLLIAGILTVSRY